VRSRVEGSDDGAEEGVSEGAQTPCPTKVFLLFWSKNDTTTEHQPQSVLYGVRLMNLNRSFYDLIKRRASTFYATPRQFHGKVPPLQPAMDFSTSTATEVRMSSLTRLDELC
jgi:hypothetical protein